MHKYLFFIAAMFCIIITHAQVGKKGTPKSVTTTDVNKMIDDAMIGLSEEDKAAIKKAMVDAKNIQSQAQNAGLGVPSYEYAAPTLPAKQVKLLSKIPVLTTSTLFDNFINNRIQDCKKNIPPQILKQVDAYFAANATNSNLVNTASFFLMQRKPQAAVYAALKLVQLKPDNILLKNNVGVILHQTGYAEMAIPIFQYILKTNTYNEVLNNQAQCYITLGDKENAKKLLVACLAKNPNNAKALCGMGLLLISEGNIAEATTYIKKSLKIEYSETAEALVNKHHLKVAFVDIKPLVVDYFNPQKYKPVPPATSVYDVQKTLLLRDQLNTLAQSWQAKAEAISNRNNIQNDSENIGQLLNNNRGYIFKTPLSKKANFLLTKLTADYYDFNKQNYKMQYENNANNLYKSLDETLALIDKEKFETRYDDCQKRITAVNSYLVKSAENLKAYQGKTIYKLYDWVNQNLQWKRYLISANEYQQQMYELVADYFKTVDGYNVAQVIYPTPVYVASNCKDEKPPTINKIIDDSINIKEEDCPLKIEIPFGVGKAKFGCNGYEIEGGELIVGGFEKNYSTGEFTIFLGLGFGEFSEGFGVGGIEGGAKVGSFVTMGKDFTVLDCGNKAELGIEGGIGSFITEVKISGTMGMETGINVNKNVFGNETPIFQYGTNN